MATRDYTDDVHTRLLVGTRHHPQAAQDCRKNTWTSTKTVRVVFGDGILPDLPEQSVGWSREGRSHRCRFVSDVQLFETATFETFGREKEVFLEGEKPNDKCYVIITGRVGIYKGKVHCSVNIGGLDKVREANQQDDKYPSFKDPIYQGENLRMLKKLSWYGNMVAKFKTGFLIGDAALLNDSPRSATVLTLEDCEFMVFHKKALDAIKMSCNKDFEGRKKFLLEMIPEMSLIKNQLRVAQLIQYFKPARYKLGAFLTHEGENSMKIFFMEEGEVTYLKNTPVPEIINGRKVRYRDKLTPISNIQGHAIIGEECIDSDPRYRYSVQVKSAEVKVLVLEKTSNFEDFQAFPLFPILLRDYKTKEKTRQTIFANIQISRIQKTLKNRHLSTKNIPQSELMQLELAAVTREPSEKFTANKIFEFEGFDREENARITGMIQRFGGSDKMVLNPKIVEEIVTNHDSFVSGP